MHRQLIVTLRASQALVDTSASGIPGVSIIPAWLQEELGTTTPTSCTAKPVGTHYVHVLELPEPTESSFGSAADKIGDCLVHAMQRVGTDKERGAGSNDARLRALFRTHLQRRRFLFSLLTAVANEAEPEQLIAFFEHLLGGTRGPGVSMQDRVH